ncbi:MAG: LysR substrate-binding domain-containing protein, partial [Hyphomicrobiales bacterium]
PNVGFTSTSFEMVRGLVGHGLGYALLATKPASAMTYDGRSVVTRPLVTDVEASRIVLARKASAPPSDSAERFAWLCRDFFCLDA